MGHVLTLLHKKHHHNPFAGAAQYKYVKTQANNLKVALINFLVTCDGLCYPEE